MSLRSWLARFKALPHRTELLDARVAALEPAITAASEAEAASAAELEAITRGTFAEIQAVRYEASLGRVDVSVRTARAAYEARVAAEVGRAADRDAAFQELLAGIDRIAARRTGLSVCVITWNHAGYLDEAIDSARAALATLPDELRGEILVLDDASDDDTPAVLERLAAAGNMRIFRSPRNLNLARARNVLLAACPTSHAVHLDADNHLSPSSLLTLFEVAREYGAAITYGEVLGSSDDGSEHFALTLAPSAANIRTGEAFDTMCVIDVAQIEGVGAYSTDPGLIGAADDYDLLLRSLRRGLAVAYVPVPVGRYRMAPDRHSAEIPDAASVFGRVRRKYLADDPDLDTWSWFAVHPATGFLYGSTAGRAYVERRGLQGERSAMPDASPSASETVLVVAPGGVGNLGDDAITDAVLGRVRSARPDARVLLVTDRDAPVLTGAPVRWLGRVQDLWAGLSEDDRKQIETQAEDGGLTDGGRLVAATTGPSLVELDCIDRIVFAGGGNLATDFADGLLYPRVGIALAAAARGIPVVWSGQGVGPCADGELACVRLAALTSQAFGCRDAGSVALVNGDADGPAELVGDDAMGMASADAATVAAARRTAGIPDGPMVIFHVRQASYVGSVDEAALAAAVDAYAHGMNATVVGLGINANEPPEPDTFIRLAQRAPRRAPWRSLDASQSQLVAAALVAQAEAVIAHSYHVALWALEAGTPTVLVTGSEYYRRKAEGLGLLGRLSEPIGLEPTPDAVGELPVRLARISSGLNAAKVRSVGERVSAWWGRQIGPGA